MVYGEQRQNVLDDWPHILYIYWLQGWKRRFIIAGLICLWNSCGLGCDTEATSRVEVVTCWGFRVLVWLCLWCILWEACPGRCIVLLCVILVDWFLLFVWCGSVGLYCSCTWEDLRTKWMLLVSVLVLWVGRDVIRHCRLVAAWVWVRAIW